MVGSTAIMLLLTACAGTGQPDAAAVHKLRTVRVSMGYIPNVQFAPFYVARKLGYYRSAGLKVSFNYQNEPDALTLLSRGSVDFVNSGGDEVLTAGAHGLHVRYVLTQYSRFPSALFFLKSRHIRTVSDLHGKTVGIPAPYGASYVGLLALLAAHHVPQSAVRIETIGYTQVQAVATGHVDAAMGYAPNEPVQLRSEGKAVGEFDVYHSANVAGAGLATNDRLIARRPGLVRAFVQATLRGLRFTLRHPRRAFTISAAQIPGLQNPKLQRQVLDRAIDFWKPVRVPLGHVDPVVWRLTARLLFRFHQVQRAVKHPTRYYTNRFVLPKR